MRVVCCKCGKKRTIIPSQLRRGHRTKEEYICRACINKEAHLRNQRPADFTAQAKIKWLAEQYRLEKVKRLLSEGIGDGTVHPLCECGPASALVRVKADSHPSDVSRVQELQTTG